MKIKIGIDPDCAKSGVASFFPGTKRLVTEAMPFFDLFDYLRTLRDDDCNHVTVYIEAGWLNAKSNYHKASSLHVAECIAKKVGANHETGRKIVEMCNYLGLYYILIQPTTAKWTKDFCFKVTGQNISNADCRDAVKLVWE